MTTITTPAPTGAQNPRNLLVVAIAAVVAVGLAFGVWTLVDNSDTGAGSVRSEPSVASRSTGLTLDEELEMIRSGSQAVPVIDLTLDEELEMIRSGSQAVPVTGLTLDEELEMIRSGSQAVPVIDLTLDEELEMIRSGSQAVPVIDLTLDEELEMIRSGSKG